MKSQDILLRLKLVSLHKQEQQIEGDHISRAWPLDWQDWEVIEGFDPTGIACFD